MNPRIAQIVEEGASQRKARFGWLARAAFLVAALAGAAGFFLSQNSPLGVAILFAALPTILALLFSVAWFAMGDPKKPAFMQMLEHRHSEIVWAYDAQVTQSVQGVRVKYHNVWLYCEDGRGAMAPVVTGHADELLLLLTEELPHATVGFSEELRATFQKSPKSLRQG